MSDIKAMVDKLERLEQEATAGPWRPVRSLTCGHLRAAHNHQIDPRREWTDADMDAIAAARNDLPVLIALAREALAGRDRDAASESHTVAKNTPSEDFGPGDTEVRVAVAIQGREYRRLQSAELELADARAATDAAWAETRKDGKK